MADCYVAAATGCLKSLSLTDHTFFNLSNVKELEPKNDEVTRMMWGGADETEIVTALVSREIKSLNTLNCSYKTLFRVPGGTGKVTGLYLTPNDQFVTGVDSGEVVVWDRKGNKLSELQGGNGLLCLDGCLDRVAVGGKECPVKVFDLEQGKQTWVSKNVPPDNLGLRVPVWETDVRLVPESDILVTGTGSTHLIRMYDMRAQRRPVRQAEWMEEPITALSLCYREHHVFAGNTKGEMSLFDLRGRSKILQVCKFKGQAGSIRSIFAHPSAPFVASCGIDRFARVHDITTRKLVSKIYCKARLNRIVMRTDLTILQKIKKEENTEDDWENLRKEGSASESEDVSDSEDDEEVWKHMESGLEKVKEADSDDEDISEAVSDEARTYSDGEVNKEQDGDSETELISRKNKDTSSTVDNKQKQRKRKVIEKPEIIEVKDEPPSDDDIQEVTPNQKKYPGSKRKNSATGGRNAKRRQK